MLEDMKPIDRSIERYLDAVLQAVEFPAGISDLNTSLTNVDRNALSHFRWLRDERKQQKQIRWKKEGDLERKRLSRRLLGKILQELDLGDDYL